MCAHFEYFFLIMRIRNLQCRGWKWTHKSLKKWWDFDKKCSFWNLFFEMKITCMPIACSVIWLFTVNDFFSVLSLWRTYACFHPNSGSKRTHYRLKNVLLKLNFQDEGHLYANRLFYILFFSRRYLLFRFLLVAYACTSPS